MYVQVRRACTVVYAMTIMRTSMSIRRMMADFRHKSAIPNP